MAVAGRRHGGPLTANGSPRAAPADRDPPSDASAASRARTHRARQRGRRPDDREQADRPDRTQRQPGVERGLLPGCLRLLGEEHPRPQRGCRIRHDVREVVHALGDIGRRTFAAPLRRLSHDVPRQPRGGLRPRGVHHPCDSGKLPARHQPRGPQQRQRLPARGARRPARSIPIASCRSRTCERTSRSPTRTPSSAARSTPARSSARAPSTGA